MGNYYHRVKMGAKKEGVLVLDVTLFKEAEPIKENKVINGVTYTYEKENEIPERTVFRLETMLSQKFIDILDRFGLGHKEILNVENKVITTEDYERILETENWQQVEVLAYRKKSNVYKISFAEYSINQNVLTERIQEIYEMVFKDHEAFVSNDNVYLQKKLGYKILATLDGEQITLTDMKLKRNIEDKNYEIINGDFWKGCEVIGLVYKDVGIENLTDEDIYFCTYDEMMSIYKASAYIETRDNQDMGAMLR